MATIGTFTKTDSGYNGDIRTLTFKAKVALTPVETGGENAPDFRVMAGAAEIGAAWNRTSKGGNSYISVKLDDPSFPAPVYANLVDRNGKPTLIWAR